MEKEKLIKRKGAISREKVGLVIKHEGRVSYNQTDSKPQFC